MKEYNDYPNPTAMVINALKQYGGWSRLFRQSASTWDEKNIVYKQNEAGFWVEWAKVRADEEFRKEVIETCKEYKKIYRDGKTMAQLKPLMAKALVESGWRPPKTRIINEMRTLKREYKEGMKCLRK